MSHLYRAPHSRNARGRRRFGRTRHEHTSDTSKLVNTPTSKERDRKRTGSPKIHPHKEEQQGSSITSQHRSFHHQPAMSTATTGLNRSIANHSLARGANFNQTRHVIVTADKITKTHSGAKTKLPGRLRRSAQRIARQRSIPILGEDPGFL